MRKVLSKDFFNREALVVAQELIGKYLCREIQGEVYASMITETEAYFGFEDKASKAHRGRTPHNEPMWGPPGRLYVYFTYGMHWMLNIVTGEKDFPAAVLIRATEEVSGPARLTKRYHIDKTLSTLPLSKKTGVWIEDRGVVILPRSIKKTPRIGIDYAGAWAKKPFRFLLQTSRR